MECAQEQIEINGPKELTMSTLENKRTARFRYFMSELQNLINYGNSRKHDMESLASMLNSVLGLMQNLTNYMDLLPSAKVDWIALGFKSEYEQEKEMKSIQSLSEHYNFLEQLLDCHITFGVDLVRSSPVNKRTVENIRKDFMRINVSNTLNINHENAMKAKTRLFRMCGLLEHMN